MPYWTAETKYTSGKWVGSVNRSPGVHNAGSTTQRNSICRQCGLARALNPLRIPDTFSLFNITAAYLILTFYLLRVNVTNSSFNDVFSLFTFFMLLRLKTYKT